MELGKTPEELVIYDPYFCQGSTVRRLASLGFPRVYNKNEDFYQVGKTGKAHIGRLLLLREVEVVCWKELPYLLGLLQSRVLCALVCDGCIRSQELPSAGGLGTAARSVYKIRWSVVLGRGFAPEIC